MGTMVQTTQRAPLAPASLPTLLPTLWRDPHTVEPEELREIIARLEHACREHPQSADLHTCLGMAQAMNHEAYLSMDALDRARRLDPEHFWAQYKFSELLYRLRALPRAEQETKRALELAQDGWQLSMARKQLQEIRRLIREGTQKPEWTKPLGRPAAWVLLFAVAASLAVVIK
jgi:hypothetical protein